MVSLHNFMCSLSQQQTVVSLVEIVSCYTHRGKKERRGQWMSQPVLRRWWDESVATTRSKSDGHRWNPIPISKDTHQMIPIVLP
jgi:hypothetical protein